MTHCVLALKSNRRITLRIACLPFAGGTASFARTALWGLPEQFGVLGVQYPGVESFLSPTFRTPQAIAEKIADEISSFMDLPLLLFGYSLGAIIAYETSKILLQNGGSAPSALIVAAAQAAHLPRTRPPISTLSHDAFIEKLRSYKGTPEVIFQDTAVLDHFIPTLRTDFAAAENYRFSPSRPLPCHIAAIAGDSDELVDTAKITPWRLHTSGSFSMHVVNGSHFFLKERPHEVCAIIQRVAEQFHNASITPV
jgi:medium-chain acyl-[acyl-carrier-protein] hydrolase